jgi:hypothetical protein
MCDLRQKKSFFAKFTTPFQVLDRNSQNAVKSAAKELRRNYAKRVADKLANLTKTSLKILSKHFAAASADVVVSASSSSALGKDAVASASDMDGGGGSRIVFVLTAYLSIPEIEVRPSIDEVQGEQERRRVEHSIHSF